MGKTEIIQQLDHIREFQLSDLKKCDEVGANFLVCVGCLNATEILGGICTGLLGGKNHVTERLRGGIDLLGGVYSKHEEDILDLRHSMVHAYLGKTKNYNNVAIMNKKDPSLICLPLTLSIQVVKGTFVVNVSTWIDDLEAAWQKLMEMLKIDEERIASVAAALARLPYLR